MTRTKLPWARPASFVLIKGSNGWWFHVIAQNGRILCHSEIYRSRRACLRAIEAVRDASMKVVEK